MKLKALAALALLALLAATQAPAAGLPEAYYQLAWCNAAEGQAEYQLPDRTRVDCLTATHAFEFDWATNWKQPITQSLHYAHPTGRRAGIILILRRKRDLRYWHRMMNVINVYGLPIDAWPIWAKEAL